MSSSDLAACQNQPDNCKTCLGKNCNLKKEYQRCIRCNSRDDIECIGNVTLNNSVICKNYLDACATGIDKFGYTHRRCTSDITYGHAKLLMFYSNINGNNKMFPYNRLQCYQCGNTDDCSFMYQRTKESKLAPCRVYSEYDKCYAYLSEGKVLMNYSEWTMN